MFFLPKLELLQKTVKTESQYKGLDLRPVAEENSLADCIGLSASALPVLSVCNPQTPIYVVSDNEYDILSPGDGEVLEVFHESPVRIMRHYALRDGSQATETFTLSTGDTIVSAACFFGDLVLLIRNSNGLFLYRYDDECVQSEKVDLSDLLDTEAGGTLSMVWFRDRLIILQNDEMHISYTMSLTQWTEYLPEEDYERSFAAQHNQFPGRLFSCGIYYRSRPVLFDDNEMYQLYNDMKPFAPVKTADVGCINPRSVAICNGILCFLSADGVMAYNGTGLPYKISEKLPDIAVTAANSGACAHGDCYYLGEYVYCFGTKEWTKLRELPEGASISTMYSDNNKILYVIKTESECTLYRYYPNRVKIALYPSEWSFTTQEFHEQEPGKKKLSQIAFRVEPTEEVSLLVEISIDGGEWQTICERELEQNGAQELRVKTPPGENFRLRFSGTGQLSIAYIRRVYQLLSDGKIHPFI